MRGGGLLQTEGIPPFAQAASPSPKHNHTLPQTRRLTHSPAAKTSGQPLPQYMPLPLFPASRELAPGGGREAQGVRVGALSPGPRTPRSPISSRTSPRQPRRPRAPPAPASPPGPQNSREPRGSLPAARRPERQAPGAAASPDAPPRCLTCRLGSAPPRGLRPAAAAGSGRPAGRPAVLLRARASRPPLPPSAVRPALAPSLVVQRSRPLPRIQKSPPRRLPDSPP